MNVSENKNKIESFINHSCMEMVACWNCKTDKAVTTARAKSDFLFNWNSLFAKSENHYKAYKELQVKVEKKMKNINENR